MFLKVPGFIKGIVAKCMKIGSLTCSISGFPHGTDDFDCLMVNPELLNSGKIRRTRNCYFSLLSAALESMCF